MSPAERDTEPTVPRPAATIILLRDGDSGLETCLVRRNLEARFMPGVWVFPGGAVDPEDGEDPTSEDAHRRCAARELVEEAGVAVDPDDLVAYSRWITPRQVPIRFDTRFYLAAHPGGDEPRVDGDEVIDWGWFDPAKALAMNRTGDLDLVFPTVKHLESLVGFGSVTESLEGAAALEIRAVEPTIDLSDEDEPKIVFDPDDRDQPGTHESPVDGAPPPGEA